MSGASRDFIKAHGFRTVSFHGLRHSHATHLLENNTHPKIVSDRLGHSTTAITLDLYSHILPTLQETVTAPIDESRKGADVTGD
jgi:integrase